MPHKDPERHREYMREYLKRYRQTPTGRAKVSANTTKWRKKNWDKHLATARRYRERYPERVKETMRRVDAMPHRVEKRRIFWASLDKSIRRAWEKNCRERRKLRITMNGGSATLEQWLARCRLYGNCCAYCGSELYRKAEMDHVIPISRGGSGWPSNLVPACRHCNAHKSNKIWWPSLPRPRGRYFSGQTEPRIVTKES